MVRVLDDLDLTDLDGQGHGSALVALVRAWNSFSTTAMLMGGSAAACPIGHAA
jgi:hypothetical protein